MIKLRNTDIDGSWDYISGIVYHNNAIDFISTEEGRAVPNGSTYSYQYNLKDHLGDVRVSMDANGVLQEDEYYAFGLRNPKYDNANNNRYLYNGKEIQTDLTNQYDYGARFYDPVIGRWTSVDPKAEQMRRHSPYNYVYDDPMKFTDPDGMVPNGPGDGEGDQTGYIRNASSGTKLTSPIRAAIIDAAHYVLDKLGINAIDNKIAEIRSSKSKITVKDAKSLGVKFVDAAMTAAVVIDGVRGEPIEYKPKVETPTEFNGQNDTHSTTSRQAFRKAKEENGIPRSKQPDKTIKPNTPEGDEAGLDHRNIVQHEFTNSNGQKVWIRQDRPALYNEGGAGDQGSHYNAGQNSQKLTQHHNYDN